VIDALERLRLGDGLRISCSLIGNADLLGELVRQLGAALDVRRVTLTEHSGPADAYGLQLNGAEPVQSLGILTEAEADRIVAGVEVVVYAGPLDVTLLEQLNRSALGAGVTLIPALVLDRRTAMVGPLMIRSRTACVREVLLWMMNSQLLPQDDAIRHIAPEDSFDTGQLIIYAPLRSVAIGFLMDYLLDWSRSMRSGRVPAYAGRALYINLERGILSLEAVLRIPGCPVCASLSQASYSERAIPSEYFVAPENPFERAIRERER
jgi:hypothetical protein